MRSKISRLFKIKDLRRKIFGVLGFLVIFRLFAAIPIPGVNVAQLHRFLSGNNIFGFLNIFSGGGLSNLSIVMLGVGPFITSIIIMQLLTLVFPKLKEMYYEEGAIGRAKFNRISKYLTVPLSFLQSYGFLNLLASQNILSNTSPAYMLGNALIVTAGTMTLVWIGDLITEFNIGNGISILIFAGIVARIPTAIQRTIVEFTTSYDPSVLTTLVIFIGLAVVVTAGIVFINEGERRIPIMYAKRVRGIKMYGGASSYLPIKVNQAGVIPIIFAIAVLMFPQFLAQASAIVSKSFSVTLNSIVSSVFQDQYLYMLIYFVLVVMFTYFYTALTFDPSEVSKNLQKSGGFIMGIRPGETTTKYLIRIINRITLWGAIFLGMVAILPNITSIAIPSIAGTGMQIGGTALLIVVAVALDVFRRINSQIIMMEYEGFD